LAQNKPANKPGEPCNIPYNEPINEPEYKEIDNSKKEILLKTSAKSDYAKY